MKIEIIYYILLFHRFYENRNGEVEKETENVVMTSSSYFAHYRQICFVPGFIPQRNRSLQRRKYSIVLHLGNAIVHMKRGCMT